MNRGVIAAADVDGCASPDDSLGGAAVWAKLTLISGAPRTSSAARPVVVFAAFVCCAVWAAPAAARVYRSAGVAPASQVVLGSSFRPIRAGVNGVLASGDYLLSTVLNLSFLFPRATAPILINDRTGTTTALDPRCDGSGLGAPWALMTCPHTSDPYGPSDFKLYSLADGTRQTVTPSPGVPQCLMPPPDAEDECASPDAVGADWIRWDATCHHCADTYLFQNIQTGELRNDPTNATTFADLNSPALAHKACPGVRLMRLFEGYSTPWGSLTPYSQFALAIGTDSHGSGAFLERCGTRMRRLLAYGSSELLSSVPPLASNVREPSLSTSGETLTIEESMTLEGENGERRNVGDEHEWSDG
jgi:hypothetical protein